MAKWEEKLLRHVEQTSDDYINIKEFEYGKIISLNPLQIINGDLPLFEDNLSINPNLLEHTREFTTLTGTVGGNTMTISNGSILFKSQLSEGDYVILREMSNKKYLVVCKV